MRKLFFILFAVISVIVNAQVTHLNMQYQVKGKVKVRPIKVEIKPSKVIVMYEIVALENIKKLTVATMNDGHLSFGSGNKLSVLGEYDSTSDTWKYLGEYSDWAWYKVSKGETLYETLCFNGTIPPGVTIINDVYSLGLVADGDGRKFDFSYIKINNPRKYYTSYVSEDEIKKNVLGNNDGICGIYEIVGNQTKSKLACINHQGQYLLVFISDNNANSWWKIGDVKAYLIPTASKGMFKASWIDKNKNKNEDAYAAFDGASLKIKILSGSDKGEHAFVKMYPTEVSTSTKIEEAVSLLENEDYRGAIKILSEIIDRKGNYDAYMLRAYAYRAMELYKSAIADYTSALNCRPGDEDA